MGYVDTISIYFEVAFAYFAGRYVERCKRDLASAYAFGIQHQKRAFAARGSPSGARSNLASTAPFILPLKRQQPWICPKATGSHPPKRGCCDTLASSDHRSYRKEDSVRWDFLSRRFKFPEFRTGSFSSSEFCAWGFSSLGFFPSRPRRLEFCSERRGSLEFCSRRPKSLESCSWRSGALGICAE